MYTDLSPKDLVDYNIAKDRAIKLISEERASYWEDDLEDSKERNDICRERHVRRQFTAEYVNEVIQKQYDLLYMEKRDVRNMEKIK